ncbi:asparagine synthase-related protein [Stenotrophomonas maltophilia]|uniref:asparagine synthase-related protein n=1 Tax=Stenotrophomonas maltophilia TaxID=40324 RepID=UPI00294FFB61|nr:asparagine synthase-related protein [Stenotrophomonas maltophilia]
MGYRYLAIVGNAPWGEEPMEQFGQEDIEERAAFGSLRLFCSRSTPSLQLPYGGVVIGHLFSRACRPIRRADELPPLTPPALAQKVLLDQCWGEYLLIDPIAGGMQALRDPSGGVGCFYALADGCGFLTSDVGLAERLHLFHKHIDWDYIVQCLVYPHQKRTRTGLAGISELLPGDLLTFHDDQAAAEPVWCPWTFVEREARHSDLAEAAASVRTTVSSVVRAWAAVDPPILLELSGGLDSSIVAACLKETGAQVSCCTLVTPVPGADERSYASLMAETLGVELHAQTLRYEDARFHFQPPANAATPRIWAFQNASDTVKQSLADRLWSLCVRSASRCSSAASPTDW